MGFDPIPSTLLPAIASFVVLLMLNQWSGKLAARGGVYAAGAQVATALTAAAVLGGVASVPLIDSIRDFITDLFNLIGQKTGSAFGAGANVIALVLALMFAYMTWKKYADGKEIKSLLLFGLAVLVAITFVPWIGEVLVWWVSHFIAVIWNILIGAINMIANRRLG